MNYKKINKFGKIELEKKYKIESKIISKKEEIELLAKRLISKGPQNKNISFNLLYRASRDGDAPNTYHNKCDGKANTICLIETLKVFKFG